MEDITLESKLEEALNLAKSWCTDNLPKYLSGFTNFDYSIFNYVIDNNSFGRDMFFDRAENGVIHVSIKQLEWLIQRERILGYPGLKVDTVSMFVHEIAEFIICTCPEVLTNYFPGDSHSIAREIENINRTNRGLPEWYG